MNPGRGDEHNERDTYDFLLEVVDLEPSGRTEPVERRERAGPTGGMRRRRIPAVIGVIVIVALVGSAIVNRSHHAASTTSSTQASDASHAHINLNNLPGGGALFPFRVGAQILTAGSNGLLLIDTDTGSVTVPRISDLPLGPVAIVAHSGSTVAVRWGADLYWFSIVNGTGSAHFMDGDAAFPATRHGHLWIAGPRSATEIPDPSNPVSTPGAAIGATSAGLLVVTKAGVAVEPTGSDGGTGGIHLLLHAPATVIGVDPDRVAWVANGCGVLRCPVHITEVATGATSSWLQLVGDPSPLAVAATAAVFSPDGSRLAMVVPDDSLTRAETLVIADLRTRATTVLNGSGRFDMPARPGSTDATGLTLDWTLDGTFVVLAPAATTGAGRVAVVDPAEPVIVPSITSVNGGASTAAIGVSSAGALDLPRRGRPGPVAGDVPTPPGAAGLSLLGADANRVDRLDLGPNHTTSWFVGGPVPNAAGPNSIARVVGGWLVVRSGSEHVVVDFLPDGGGAPREIAPGFQVYSSGEGRHAWIVNFSDGPFTTVQSYDPSTGSLGSSILVASGQMAATDVGLVIAVDSLNTTRFNIVDSSDHLRTGPVFGQPPIQILAAAGAHVVYHDTQGLHVFDITTGANRIVTRRLVASAALSPDGRNLAWIDNDTGTPSTVGVRAMVLGGDTISQISNGADRVFVDDRGFVLFTNGENVFSGRVGAAGAGQIFGLAPDPDALLALG